MKTEIMEKINQLNIYELITESRYTDMYTETCINEEISAVRNRIEEAIKKYEISNNLLASFATINKSTLKEAVEKVIKLNESTTVYIANASSTITYRVVLNKGTLLNDKEVIFYSVIASVFKYKEA